MCTVLLPPGGNTIAVNKYIISKFAWVEKTLRFKLGTVHLEFNGKMPLGLFLERLSFHKNFMDLSYLFPCAVGLNGQPITARLVSLSRNSIRLWSRNMTLGMVSIRGESPKWRRFVRAWILCVHVLSRLPDWHESQQDGHIIEGHFEVIFCITLGLSYEPRTLKWK
jgi:hypothetical protein